MNPPADLTPFDWIALSRELKAIAEAGLRYTEGVYSFGT